LNFIDDNEPDFTIYNLGITSSTMSYKLSC